MCQTRNICSCSKLFVLHYPDTVSYQFHFVICSVQGLEISHIRQLTTRNFRFYCQHYPRKQFQFRYRFVCSQDFATSAMFFFFNCILVVQSRYRIQVTNFPLLTKCFSANNFFSELYYICCTILPCMSIRGVLSVLLGNYSLIVALAARQPF